MPAVAKARVSLKLLEVRSWLWLVPESAFTFGGHEGTFRIGKVW